MHRPSTFTCIGNSERTRLRPDFGRRKKAQSHSEFSRDRRNAVCLTLKFPVAGESYCASGLSEFKRCKSPAPRMANLSRAQHD